MQTQQQQPAQNQRSHVQRAIQIQNQQFQQSQPQVQQQRVPLTKEQYKRLLLAHHIKKQQERQRIREIKSTKLLFSNPAVGISPSTFNGNNHNRLFKFVGN
jgi:hypothetical protein